MKRVFIGLPLTDEARRGVSYVMKKLGRKHWKVKWEPEEKWHVTLVFLGNLEQEQVGLVGRVMEKVMVGRARFELGFRGLGAFPDLVLPRSLHLRLRGDLQSLHRLRKSIEEGLGAGGLEVRRRPYVAHVTLGRVRKECGRKERLEIGREVRRMREIELTWCLKAERVVVYESRLKEEGSYRELMSWELERMGWRQDKL